MISPFKTGDRVSPNLMAMSVNPDAFKWENKRVITVRKWPDYTGGQFVTVKGGGCYYANFLRLVG